MPSALDLFRQLFSSGLVAGYSKIGTADMASGKVYNALNEFLGHVEQEGGYYHIYRGWTDHVGWVEEEGGYYPVYQAETLSLSPYSACNSPAITLRRKSVGNAIPCSRKAANFARR